MRVVCTTGMIADVVRGVVGEHGDVRCLCNPGVDPHTFKPTRTHVKQLFDADVIFYNGLGLEARMTDVLVRLASDGKRVVAVTEQLDDSTLLEPDEFEGHFDPHVWNDPSAWASAAAVIAEELAAYDPTHAREYWDSGEAVARQIEEVTEYARQCYASIPEDQRVLITSHDAFNYLGRAFGLEVLGIQGISTDSQAGLDDVNQLVAMITDRKIAAVFTENISSNRNVLALVEGCGARGWTVRIGGEVFSDAFGELGTYEGTYIGMVDHNATTITRALGGEAPERGFQGKLSPEGSP